MDDKDLVLALRESDTGVFNEIVKTNKGWLGSVIHRQLHDNELTEETVQEVLLRLWAKRLDLREDSNIANWLYTVAINLCRNEKRKKTHSWFQGPRVNEGCPQQSIMSRYRKYYIKRAVEGLPEGQREVFVLAQLEGLPYEKVASILDIPVGTVKSRMYHALSKLRITLEKHREVLLHEL